MGMVYVPEWVWHGELEYQLKRSNEYHYWLIVLYSKYIRVYMYMYMYITTYVLTLNSSDAI